MQTVVTKRTVSLVEIQDRTVFQVLQLSAEGIFPNANSCNDHELIAMS